MPWACLRAGIFSALDTTNGQRLWFQKIGGAIAGGVIIYAANGANQRNPKNL